ncbi:MAG: NmrA family NAD(P)-binding protein [Terracoccus sp.]
MDLVLVIGATGKTGRAVTRAVTSRHVAVRAAVHSPTHHEAAYAAGAQSISVVDLETGTGLDEAVHGVTGVYHLAPNVHPDEVGIAERVVTAAAAAGADRFVFHSVLQPDDPSMPHHLRKAEAEVVIRAVLPAATVLRPAAYHQNLVDGARTGRLDVPYSVDAPFTNVDLDDVAEVAATALTEPGHAGLSYDLAGAESLTVRQQAQVAERVLGHPVITTDTGLEAWLAGPGANLSEQVRDDLAAMFRRYDAHGLSGDSAPLTRLLGRRPTTWGAVLAR